MNFLLPLRLLLPEGWPRSSHVLGLLLRVLLLLPAAAAVAPTLPQCTAVSPTVGTAPPRPKVLQIGISFGASSLNDPTPLLPSGTGACVDGMAVA